MKIWYISELDKPFSRTSRVLYFSKKFVEKGCEFILSTSSYDKFSRKNYNKNNKNFKFKKINKINTIFI